MPITTSLRSFLKNNLGLFILLALIILITYLNILPNQLFFDDEELIYKNTYVADLGYFPKYFTSNMIEGAGKISNMYRPLLITSFAIDHLIWGNNPIGYHLTSIFLHLANSWLIFSLLIILIKNKSVSFLSALLFGIHPAISEAVIYASGRTDPLYVFWGLISIICFILLFKTNKFNYLIYIISLVCFSISFLIKETAVVIPFLSLISVLYKYPLRHNLRRLFILIVPFILLIIGYILLRLTILNFSNTLNFYSGLSTDQITQLYSSNIFIRLFTFTKVLFTYLMIIILPKELAIARVPQVITNISNFYVLLFFFSNLILFLASCIFLKKTRMPMFLFLWFYISFLPVSGIIPINNIIAEHYLYLPSLSFFLFFSILVTNLITKTKHHIWLNNILKIILLIIIIGLSFRTILRTFDWRDPITFYSLSLKQSPRNIPIRHNLAMSYQDRGDLNLAINEYNNIISLGDIYPQTRHNLGNAYKNLRKYSEAENEYKKALEIDPKFYFTYFELADLYQKTGDKEKLNNITAIINKLNTK
jgi:tetratricopeptide (TPR) repeat protein